MLHSYYKCSAVIFLLLLCISFFHIDTPDVTVLAEKFDEVFGKTCSPFHFTGGATDSTAQSFEFTFIKPPKSPSSLTRAMAATLTVNSLDEMTEEEEAPVLSHVNQLDDSLDSPQPMKQKGLVLDYEENMVTEVCACFTNAYFNLIIP